MVTRRGICHNLKESEYVVVVDEVKYYFSSQYYQRKFYTSYRDNRFIMQEALMKKYGVNAHLNILFDLVLYEKIELRGFHVIYKGVVYECLDEINLYLQERINKS